MSVFCSVNTCFAFAFLFIIKNTIYRYLNEYSKLLSSFLLTDQSKVLRSNDSFVHSNEMQHTWNSMSFQFQKEGRRTIVHDHLKKKMIE